MGKGCEVRLAGQAGATSRRFSGAHAKGLDAWQTGFGGVIEEFQQESVMIDF